MNLPFDQPFLMAVAVLVAVVGVGRVSRILTYDDFPPAEWARLQWLNLTRNRKTGDNGKWGKLAVCQWCATPWIMAVCIAWGGFSSLHWSWWVFWGWMALSYAASIVIARDEPE